MDFLFRPSLKQTAGWFALALASLAALVLLVRVASPAEAAQPQVFKWEGSPPNTKVALIADLGSCQVFRIRVFTSGHQYYKEVFVIQNSSTSQRPSCGIAS